MKNKLWTVKVDWKSASGKLVRSQTVRVRGANEEEASGQATFRFIAKFPDARHAYFRGAAIDTNAA